jgi:hypothetical protein
MASQPRVELMIPEDSMERTVPREAPAYHEYKKLVGKTERCAPPAPPIVTLLFLPAMKTPRKRPVWEKICKSGKASLLAILFNNATAGGLNRE